MVNVKDYYDYIKQLFPDVSTKDIKRILNYGFKLLYLLNSYGGDVIIKDNDFWSYIGTLTNNSVKYFHYYKNKLTIRMRVLHKRKNMPWDGYYYFALSDALYNEYLKLCNTKGRKRKNFKFGSCKLFKLYDECKIQEFSKKYIFKVSNLLDLGYTIFKKDFMSDKAELILVRSPQKFKDILVDNNKYEVL